MIGATPPVARKVIEHLVDDLDGSAAAGTIRFGFDGVSYEIDLSTVNAERLRAELAPYVNAARKVSGNGRARAVKVAGVAPGSKAENRAIREWANTRGKTLSGRGRIPREVVEEYRARSPLEVAQDASTQAAPAAAFSG